MAGQNPVSVLAELERMRREAEGVSARPTPAPAPPPRNPSAEAAASRSPVGPARTAMDMYSEITGRELLMPEGDYEPGDEMAASTPEPAGSMTGELLRKIMEFLVSKGMKNAQDDEIREDHRRFNQI